MDFTLDKKHEMARSLLRAEKDFMYTTLTVQRLRLMRSNIKIDGGI